MKPSEKRALEAEKKARKAAEAREYELTGNYRADKKDTHGSKEGFAQSHVRLITFIICMLVLIPVCLFGTDMLVAKTRGETVANKRELTLDFVYTIAKAENNITWEYFDKFNYTDRTISHQGVTTVVREYSVTDTELTVRVVGIGTAKGYPNKVLLIDYWSGEFVDLRDGSDAVDDLLAKLKEEESQRN